MAKISKLAHKHANIEQTMQIVKPEYVMQVEDANYVNQQNYKGQSSSNLPYNIPTI